jgi:chromosome segregation ATPase
MNTTACLLGVLLLVATGAQAQDKVQEQAKRQQALIQKLANDKASLERDRAQLSRDKADLSSARDSLKRDLDKQKRQAARGAKESEALRAEVAAAAEREQALKAELAKTTEELQEARRTGEQLTKRLANQSGTSRYWETRADSCGVKNVKLAELNAELLNKYQAKTCGDALMEAEPFTGVRRAEVENMIQEYKDKASRERFDPRADPAAKAEGDK